MMECTKHLHIGRKIERIRCLLSMTQTDLGNLLGVTKQAISKMERAQEIDSEKLKEVAEALGVTEAGLKKFNEDTVLCYTNDSHGKYNVGESSTMTLAKSTSSSRFSMDQTVKLFEELLKIEREKYNKEKGHDNK